MGRKKAREEPGEEPLPIIEVEHDVRALSHVDLKRARKTTNILVHPKVITDFLARAALYPHNEVGSLLIGRIDGRFLVVEDQVHVEDVGTATRVEFPPQVFEQASEALEAGQCVVGWAHSHPTFGAFLSSTDVRHQSQGQDLFSDYVALVVDPFRGKGAEYCFFRVTKGNVEQVPHAYLGGGKRAP